MAKELLTSKWQGTSLKTLKSFIIKLKDYKYLTEVNQSLKKKSNKYLEPLWND